MAENSSTNKPDRSTRDGLALIIGGIFILALVFAAYNYFNQPKPLNVTEKEENVSVIDKIKDVVSPKKDEGTLNGNGVSDEKVITPKPTIETQVKGTTTSNTQEWIANDYQKGDIVTKTYQVVSGDTLWEIAEAAYGDGTQWTKILDANSTSIGFLPNGQQALILPGQMLNLP